jgi:hypothetical protein
MTKPYRTVPFLGRPGELLVTGYASNAAIRRLVTIHGARLFYRQHYAGDELTAFTVVMPSREAWRIDSAIGGSSLAPPTDRYHVNREHVRRQPYRRDRSYAQVEAFDE